MNAADVIVLALLAAALFFAIRAIGKGETGGCSGNCSGCVNAGSCSGCKAGADNKSSDIKIKRKKRR